MIEAVLALLVAGAVLSNIVARIVAKMNEKLGITGVDIHKPSKPRIPEACGLALIIAYSALLLVAWLVGLVSTAEALVLALPPLYAGLIGLLDDLVRLDAKTKTLLTLTIAAPVLALGAYDPRPLLPLIGGLRITILYPCLLPFAYAVAANAVNMFDTYNGTMTSTAFIACLALCFIEFYALMHGVGSTAALLGVALLTGVLAGYLPLNLYPARVFNGDTGSFFIGAALASIAILGRIEVALIAVMMPYIINGFYIIASVGGLRERSEMVRPVKLEGYYIKAVKDPRAPITLVHLLTLKKPLTEKEVVAACILLEAVAAILGLLLAVFTY